MYSLLYVITSTTQLGSSKNDEKLCLRQKEKFCVNKTKFRVQNCKPEHNNLIYQDKNSKKSQFFLKKRRDRKEDKKYLLKCFYKMTWSIPSSVSENKLPRLFLLRKYRDLRNYSDRLDIWYWQFGTGSWTGEGEKGGKEIIG